MSDVQGIGWAVKQMHNGKQVCRSGWNGKNVWIGLWKPSVPVPGDHDAAMTVPFVYMFTADGQLVPWLCSQTDLLAVDWQLA